MYKPQLKPNGTFRFLENGSVSLKESAGNQSREPWLMLMARRNMPPLSTLCWGQTSSGSAFSRIGTQEADLVNGFVHEDPYKTRLLGPYVWFAEEGPADSTRKPFTNAWYPLNNPDQELETIFNFGSLTSKTACEGIAVTTTAFIPNGFDAMVQLVTVKNDSETQRTFRAFNTWPVNIGDARDIQFSGFNTLMMGGGRFDSDHDAVAWRCHYGIPLASDPDTVKGLFGKVLVHATSLERPEFSTKYEDFYGHWSAPAPEALTRGTLPCLPAEELTSALSCLMGRITVKPGEEKTFTFALVAADSEDYYERKGSELARHLALLRSPEKVSVLLEETEEAWRDELNRLEIGIPGEETLEHSFRWLQYQCSMVAALNRMKSRFHSGFEYGYGFRDILQDILALLPYDSQRVGENLKFIAAQMFSDGTAYHNFFASAPGNRDFHACDDPLWYVFALCEYVKETGDYGILATEVPFADEKEGLPGRAGTLLERASLAIEQVWTHSDSGLPVMFDADWNDDLGGYSEHLSVMTAEMLFRACLDLAELLSRSETVALGLTGRACSEADLLRTRAETIRAAFTERAIDREGRFVRLLSPDTEKAPHLGSCDSDGLTFFEPVAWAGISGIVGKEAFLRAAEHAERDLADTAGYAICPADTNLACGKLPADYAAWKRNAPGKKENGGAFRHLESWYIASLCSFGFGKRAADIFRATLPAVSSEADPYTYAAERFVYPEYVSGPGSIEHGRAGHTWLTGTAPTRQRVFVESILGLAADWDGLSVRPCVDPAWKAFSATRSFRGTKFAFSFENPQGAEAGVKELWIDGVRIFAADEASSPAAAAGSGVSAARAIIPAAYCDGGEHRVTVVMGASR